MKYSFMLVIINDGQKGDVSETIARYTYRDVEELYCIEAPTYGKAKEEALRRFKELYEKDPKSYPFDKFYTWDFEKMRFRGDAPFDSGSFEITLNDDSLVLVTMEHHVILNNKKSYDGFFSGIEEVCLETLDNPIIDKEKGVIAGYNKRRTAYKKWTILS